MTNTICNVVASYLEDLTATNEICSSFGSTLTAGSNLFMYSEPYDASDMVTIIPYGGSPPDKDNYKFESSVQIRIKSSNMQTLMSTQQAIINTLNRNSLSGNGLMISNNSVPIYIGSTEGNEFKIAVSNFRIKYIKV